MSDNIGCVGCDIKHCPFMLSYRKPVYRGYVVGIDLDGSQQARDFEIWLIPTVKSG